MSDDGYTLAEMLAALAILGMAMGGLGVVASLVARQQLAANRIHLRLVDDRAADRALTLWLDQQDAGTLNGDARGLSATCGPATCEARLAADRKRTVLILRGRSGSARRLRLRHSDVRFSYVGDQGVVSAWPRTDVSVGEVGEVGGGAPRAVLLTAVGATAPLAVARAWGREARDCQFDAIIRACRATTP